MLSDLEIAQQAKLKPIVEIAEKLGIQRDELELYGDYKAKVKLAVTPGLIQVVIDDEGKGIPDVDLAMQRGYTTATEEMRAMGFGSGMGLPNIKKNSDELDIKSEVGKGTTLKMIFYT